MLFEPLAKRFTGNKLSRLKNQLLMLLWDPSASDDDLIEDDKIFEIYKRKNDLFLHF
jgi:hypothetical protein